MKEAMKLALEALKANQPINYCINNNGEKFPMFSNDPMKQERNEEAIKALEEALAKQEQGEPVAWTADDIAYRPNGLPQEFISHEVESPNAWSKWVCPKPEQYFMKCCDCGLVHEMQFKVAKYSEGDECEFVADANLQAVFRARRTTPPAAQQEQGEPVAWVDERAVAWLADRIGKPSAHITTKLSAVKSFERPMPIYITPPQRTWVGLTNEEMNDIWSDQKRTGESITRAIEAKLKEKNDKN
jgi:hypothetical protein